MKLDKSKVLLIMAKKNLTTLEVSEKYGVSRSRINSILNSASVRPTTVHKMAAALDCEVDKIIEK